MSWNIFSLFSPLVFPHGIIFVTLILYISTMISFFNIFSFLLLWDSNGAPLFNNSVKCAAHNLCLILKYPVKLNLHSNFKIHRLI